jgi:ABC-type arginine/histidine transport system permease subunit
MLLLVAISVIVACNINVNMTLAQTIENHLFGLKHSRDVIILNFFI